jgi:hypothetical protein
MQKAAEEKEKQAILIAHMPTSPDANANQNGT